MKALMDQLRALPTANLIIYLLGVFAVMCSMAFLHGIKPAYLDMQELRKEQQHLERLAKRFDLNSLKAEIENTKAKQTKVLDQMLANIPDRNLDETLPTLLEQLHRMTKYQGLRTQKLKPGDIERNSGIATVPVSISVVGTYARLYHWIDGFADEFSGVSVADISADKNPGSNGFRTLSMNLVIYGR